MSQVFDIPDDLLHALSYKNPFGNSITRKNAMEIIQKAVEEDNFPVNKPDEGTGGFWTLFDYAVMAGIPEVVSYIKNHGGEKHDLPFGSTYENLINGISSAENKEAIAELLGVEITSD